MVVEVTDLAALITRFAELSILCDHCEFSEAAVLRTLVVDVQIVLCSNACAEAYRGIGFVVESAFGALVRAALTSEGNHVQIVPLREGRVGRLFFQGLFGFQQAIIFKFIGLAF